MNEGINLSGKYRTRANPLEIPKSPDFYRPNCFLLNSTRAPHIGVRTCHVPGLLMHCTAYPQGDSACCPPILRTPHRGAHIGVRACHVLDKIIIRRGPLNHITATHRGQDVTCANVWSQRVWWLPAGQRGVRPCHVRPKHPRGKYIRYMDDWLVFTRTRGHLRRAVKTAHVVLSKLKLIKHPDKTFIGRLSRTFEFCGFRFSTNGVVALAKATLNNHTQTQSKLYEHEQGASVKHKNYQAGFLAWVRGVLGAAVLRELLTRPMSEWCPRSATQRRAAV